ncbi:hypothetical protein HOS50_gp060 [Lactobacillus phage Lenus]|uniref:Uncharacterized protein n=1 Tax=Lactobacillus phage Lenus TaxID=2053682 RepID=A0A2H4PB68_9CAUD|nr:hypothetical protein HOS50_gp060 [Lactobacillus phage Lenus]ATW59477.1 hypothetical protein [Lactobacillus phage Lenus]
MHIKEFHVIENKTGNKFVVVKQDDNETDLEFAKRIHMTYGFAYQIDEFERVLIPEKIRQCLSEPLKFQSLGNIVLIPFDNKTNDILIIDTLDGSDGLSVLRGDYTPFVDFSDIKMIDDALLSLHERIEELESK